MVVLKVAQYKEWFSKIYLHFILFGYIPLKEIILIWKVKNNS